MPTTSTKIRRIETTLWLLASSKIAKCTRGLQKASLHWDGRGNTVPPATTPRRSHQQRTSAGHHLSHRPLANFTITSSRRTMLTNHHTQLPKEKSCSSIVAPTPSFWPHFATTNTTATTLSRVKASTAPGASSPHRNEATNHFDIVATQFCHMSYCSASTFKIKTKECWRKKKTKEC